MASSRADLIRRIAGLERDLARARSELAELDQGPRRRQQREPVEAVTHRPVTRLSPTQDKLDLFMARFTGRTDVYAHRWVSASTGKPGWSPTTRHRVRKGEKVRPEDCVPLTRQAVERHLAGSRKAAPTDTREPFHIGLYPLRKDDTCHLLACDFDGKDWQTAAAAYADECVAAGLDCLAEISSSGHGAHIWLFFATAVPAALARRAGLTLLRRTMTKNRLMSFSSYDRLFPSQDKLPFNSPGRGAFGNLIALPLQGDRRAKGKSVFADPHRWQPLPDQFQALDEVRLASTSALTQLADDDSADVLGPANVPGDEQNGTDTGSLRRARPRRSDLRSLRPQIKGSEITLRRDSGVRIPTAGMPSAMVADLKHLASLANPEFYRKQAGRYSTFNTPRVVVRFADDGTDLRIPRGLLEEARAHLERAGYTVYQRSPRRKRPAVDIDFTGELRDDQCAAVAEIAKHDTGILVAPPGTGKTVMACALIAKRKVPTAIVVPSTELLRQWRERLGQFLDIPDKQIGQLGAGRRKTKGQVDLFMMRTVAHRDADPAILNAYGQIIVDECHGAAAPAAEEALAQVDAPRWVGLTATPYRSDGLDGLITMQCGPIRYQLERPAGPESERTLLVHHTSFTTEEPGAGGHFMPDLYAELVANRARNELLIAEISRAARTGAHALVLTNRIDHLQTLATGIRESLEPATTRPDGTKSNPAGEAVAVLVLHGRLTSDERASERSRLAAVAASGKPFVLVAIDKVAGEGFDLPALDTLFLTMPMSFKGRVVQNLGRITRGNDGSGESTGTNDTNGTDGTGKERAIHRRVTVHDFHDSQVAVLDRMFTKRLRAIKKEGFELSKAAPPDAR